MSDLVIDIDIYSSIINELEKLNKIDCIDTVDKLCLEGYKVLGTLDRFEIKKDGFLYNVLSIEEFIALVDGCNAELLKDKFILNDFGVYIKEAKMAEFAVKYHYNNKSDLFPLENEYRINKQFDIGDVHFEINDVSIPFGFVVSNYCNRELLGFDCENISATIKIFNVEESVLSKCVVQGLFVANAYSFNPKNMGIVLDNLLTPLDVYVFSNDDFDSFFNDRSALIINPKLDNFSEIILTLYVNAQKYMGKDKFLYLYRILEYFADYNLSIKIKEERFNKNIDNKEFEQTLKCKNNERNMLELLFRMILSEDEVKETEKKLGKFDSRNIIKSFTEKMYRYRNSLVHAKYSNEDINYNSIFTVETTDVDIGWCEIAHKCVLTCIDLFNGR